MNPQERAGLLVFLDTEFTHFVDHLCQLISVGLVDATGTRELYVELSDWDSANATDFVLEVVRPLLGRDPGAVCTRSQAKERITRWFAQLPEPADVISDSARDLKLIEDLVGKPINLSRYRVVSDVVLGAVEDAIEDRFEGNGKERHQALVDARVLREAYLAVLGGKPDA